MRTFKIIVFFLFSLILFVLAYKGIREQNMDINDCSKITSVILDKGTAYRKGSKGSSLCFYLQLKDAHKLLGVYRMSQNYDDLIHTFNIDDTITAYFIDNSNTAENINIDLVQVEKGKEVLLPKKEYERKERWPIYIGVIGGTFMMLMAYLYYKKKI